MPVFLCRWPNGDMSIVYAADTTEAAILLDEFGNPDEGELHELEDLLIDFRLEDDGIFHVKQWGEATHRDILETAFPHLDEAENTLVDPEADPPWDAERVRAAVEVERNRPLAGRPDEEAPQARTEHGRTLQKSLGAPAALVDHLTEIAGENILKKTDTKGPKH